MLIKIYISDLYDLRKITQDKFEAFRHSLSIDLKDIMNLKQKINVKIIERSHEENIEPFIIEFEDLKEKISRNEYKNIQEIFASTLTELFSNKELVTAEMIKLIIDDIAEDSSNESNVDKDDDELDTQQRAKQYLGLISEPHWDFDTLILPEKVLNDIKIALKKMEFEPIIYDTFGLRKFDPYAKTALNFFGQPGTGKTLAANAIAKYLGKKILIASYAEIESKYVGEGSKNIKAIFLAAQQENAILFIDEADSLLSKRLTNVNQGSDQAINSMRSQMLICMENFNGIAIFATNLVKNYDYAFETRLRSIHFELPDESCRLKIWQIHMLPTIPGSEKIDLEELAHKYDDFCGRDIKNAIIEACIIFLMDNRKEIETKDIVTACDNIVEQREKLRDAHDDTQKETKVSKLMNDKISEKIAKSLDDDELTSVDLKNE